MDIKDKCPFCGCEKMIEAELAINNSLLCLTNYKSVLTDFNQQISVKVCANCGSIVRLYVREPEKLLKRKR